MEISVIKGEKHHLRQVLGLIKELALYEKAPSEVEITLEELERDGFGGQPVFGFFVALDKDLVVGMALYYVKYSTWKGKCIYLDDIIVTEPYRGRNIGKKLFVEVAKVSKNLNARKMEWQVLDWNVSAIGFYKKFDVHFDDTWINCKLTEDQINQY
jgi:GNAT superfamily N-acetyltransferase